MNRRTLALVSVTLLALSAGCGSEDGADGPAPDTSTDEAAIQELFADYTAALDSGTFDEVCAVDTQELNDELVTELREAVGDATATCARALETMSGEPLSRGATLRDLEVFDDTAEGAVGPNRWRFARVDGSWKVAHAD